MNVHNGVGSDSQVRHCAQEFKAVALLLQGIHIDVIRTLLEKGASSEKVFKRKKVDLKNLDPEIKRLLRQAASKKG